MAADAPATAVAPTAPPPRVKQLTLMLLHTDGQVLLGMKKRGFGAGKFNGFGGKIDPGETVVAAAVREMEEESGVRVLDPAHVGRLVFEFEGHDEALHVHVFTAARFTGEVKETEEMAPQWFPACAPPLERMWADDAHWLPALLAGGPPFDGHFTFRGHDTIVRHELRDVPGGWPPEAAQAVLVTELQGPITA